MIRVLLKIFLIGLLSTKMIPFKNSYGLLLVTLFLSCCSTLPVKITSDNLAYGQYVSIVGGTEEERQMTAMNQCKKLYYNYDPIQTHRTSKMQYDVKTGEISEGESYTCQLADQPNLTSLQLKQIQSRIFNTSMAQVFTGLQAYYRDLGGDCFLYPRTPITNMKDNISDNLPQQASCRLGSFYNLNIELSEIETATLLRLRLKYGFRLKPITTTKDYNVIFKGIADQLFIEAIPLQISEMR